MSIQDALEGLSLNKKEASTYVTLLELGEATILAISQKSGLKRPTTYLVLRSLEGKGFASRVIRGKKTLYTPQHPKKLLTEAELRLKELQEIVPQLTSLFRKEEGRPRVMIYEGKDELDRAYDESFVVKGEVLYMGTLKLSQEVFPRTFKKYEYANLAPDFRVREIQDGSEESRKYAEKVRGPYHAVRFMPKEMLPFEADIGIFGNRTLITSVKKEYFTVAIESEEIARAFRAIFEVVWQKGNEF